MSSKHILIGTDNLWTILYHQLQYPERCRQTKDWWPKPDKERSNQILSLKRKQWGKMVQFMTGHNHLARHNNIVDPNESPTCSLCDFGYPQDTAHIIGECPDPHLMKIRIDIFGERYIVPPFNHLATGKVLAFLLQSGLSALDWWPEQT